MAFFEKLSDECDDGFTKKLTASFYVIPFKKYHIKIAIGDVGDQIFDSGVFIEKESFISIRDTNQHNFKEYTDISEKLDFDSIFGKIDNTNHYSIDNTNEPSEYSDIFFDNNEVSIPDSSKIMLNNLAEYLVKNESYSCVLWGYTDNIGSKKSNQKLSENRAKEVKSFLVLAGLSPDRIEYKGMNENSPLGDNLSEEGRAQNRRVEIIIIEK